MPPIETIARGETSRRAILACLGTIWLGALSPGCSWYRPAPLPAAAAPLRTTLPTRDRLRADAASIANPLFAGTNLDVEGDLDPDEAAVLALVLNPDLVAARDARGEAAAQLVQAGLLPDPSLAADILQPYGAQARGLITSLNFGLSIDARTILTLPARREVARQNMAQVDLGIAWQEWQVAQSARLLTVRLAWLERRLDLLQHEIALEAEATAALGRALDAGDVTATQLGVQRAALEGHRRQRDDLEQIVAQTRAELLGLFGNPRGLDTDVRVTAPRTAVRRLPDVDAVLPACLERRLDLEALRRGYDAQDARLWQAVIEQLPDLTVGVARQRDESSVNFLGGLVTVGIPIFDRNQAQIALAEATRERMRHEYEARVMATRTSLDALTQVGDVIARRLPEVTRAIEPLSRAEALDRAAAARGDLDQLVYQTLRTALLEQRLQEATLAQGLAEALVGIATTCGGDVSPAADMDLARP